MTPHFDEIVGLGGTPEERASLRAVHDLLVSAYPPPDFDIPVVRSAGTVRRRRGRRLAVLALAAALAVSLGVSVLPGT